MYKVNFYEGIAQSKNRPFLPTFKALHTLHSLHTWQGRPDFIILTLSCVFASSISWCVQLYIFMCGDAGTCVHMHVKATAYTGCLPQLLSYYFLREDFSLNLFSQFRQPSWPAHLPLFALLYLGLPGCDTMPIFSPATRHPSGLYACALYQANYLPVHSFTHLQSHYPNVSDQI